MNHYILIVPKFSGRSGTCYFPHISLFFFRLPYPLPVLPLWPPSISYCRIAIVFSLLMPVLLNFWVSHSFVYFLRLSAPSSCLQHIPFLPVYLAFLPQIEFLRVFFLLLPTAGTSLSSFRRVQAPHTKLQFQLFRVPVAV